MTWYMSVAADNSEMTVIDHTGAEVTTVANDGRGFSTEDVLDLMADEIDAALAAGNVDRAVQIGRDAACEQIERGQP
jgi:hypothetical protein